MRKQINPSILKSKDIEELELSVLSYNSLKRAGVNSLYEVQQLIDKDKLTEIRNIGEKAKQEIINKLKKFLIKLEYKNEKYSTMSDMSDVYVGHFPVSEFPNYISINSLKDALGEELVFQLKSIGIKTIGDVQNLASHLLDVLKNKEKFIEKAIYDLGEKVKQKVGNSGLQTGIMVNGKKLYSVLYLVPKSLEEKLQKYNDLQKILCINSLEDELISIYEGISTRDKTIFVRYSLGNITYRDLGDKFNNSRERVRQIYNQTVQRLCDKLKNTSSLYLQSALLIADNMGEHLTEEKLRKELIRQGMIAFQDQDTIPDTFELMLALIMNPDTSVLIEMKNLESE